MPTNSRRRSNARKQARADRKAAIESQYGVKIVNSRPENLGRFTFRSHNEAAAHDRAAKMNRYGK